MDTTLPQRLRLLRGEMPQAEFAAKVGIHKSSWGRYERGVGEPTATDLAGLCAVCGVTPLWLLCGQGDMRREDAVVETSLPSGPDSVAPAAEGECPAAEPAPPAPPASSTSTPQEYTPKKETEDLPACRQCRWLEERLEQADRERREVAQENRQLWRENSELRERIARLEERARHNAGA